LEIKRYGEQIDLYKTGLIPQGRAALESAIAEYGVNKVDFVTLINNQITFYNYEIDYYVVLTDYENTIAEVEATVGKRLF
jgi:cobalt-zinc-cadmium efflux system outer membrane protein